VEAEPVGVATALFDLLEDLDEWAYCIHGYLNPEVYSALVVSLAMASLS
jgi:hypothetical protein